MKPLDATVDPGSGQGGDSLWPATPPTPHTAKMTSEKKDHFNLESHLPLGPGRPGVPGSPDVIEKESVRMITAQQSQAPW